MLPSPSEFETRGYAVVRDVIDGIAISSLMKLLSRIDTARSERGGDVFGIRDLLYLDEIRALARSEAVTRIVLPLIGGMGDAVRGIFFDKTPAANWPVPWHQDLSLAVASKHELDGWRGWSLKNGILHAQPPANLLERMVTIRLHLDDCCADNGPLKVRPGTHRAGRLSRQQIQALGANVAEDLCCAKAGDAVVMRPLLLHSSSPAANPGHRRVIHLEFAPEGLLPSPLRWAFEGLH